jgi:uncharacterized protein YaiI (UPF0178 family)
MKFWIDGDSCPRQAMDIALRVHERGTALVVVVADRNIPAVAEKGAQLIIVPHGSGEADELIARDSESGDIALTRDLALGIRLLQKGLTVLNDRGKIWSLAELRARTEEADLMRALRDGGIAKKAHRRYDAADLKSFAATLDRLLSGHR